MTLFTFQLFNYAELLKNQWNSPLTAQLISTFLHTVHDTCNVRFSEDVLTEYMTMLG